MIPGEYVLSDQPIECNAGRKTLSLQVTNTGDRPVQVGSHYHLPAANSALRFDRKAAHGYRLDIPAGTAVRFEPGDSKTVNLVALAGRRHVYGLANLVNGPLDNPLTVRDADAAADAAHAETDHTEAARAEGTDTTGTTGTGTTDTTGTTEEERA